MGGTQTCAHMRHGGLFAPFLTSSMPASPPFTPTFHRPLLDVTPRKREKNIPLSSSRSKEDTDDVDQGPVQLSSPRTRSYRFDVYHTTDTGRRSLHPSLLPSFPTRIIFLYPLPPLSVPSLSTYWRKASDMTDAPITVSLSVRSASVKGLNGLLARRPQRTHQDWLPTPDNPVPGFLQGVQ